MNNSLYFYWNIGRLIYENKNQYINIIERYSKYYSYCYGNSYLFTRENLHFMKRFYINFPIFYSVLDQITWEQYKLLLNVPDMRQRYFYFYLSLFFHSDYSETLEFIHNNYYSRI